MYIRLKRIRDVTVAIPSGWTHWKQKQNILSYCRAILSTTNYMHYGCNTVDLATADPAIKARRSIIINLQELSQWSKGAH